MGSCWVVWVGGGGVGCLVWGWWLGSGVGLGARGWLAGWAWLVLVASRAGAPGPWLLGSVRGGGSVGRSVGPLVGGGRALSGSCVTPTSECSSDVLLEGREIVCIFIIFLSFALVAQAYFSVSRASASTLAEVMWPSSARE